MTSSARTDHGKSKTRSSIDRMTGFAGLTGEVRGFLGLKTLFFNLKLLLSQSHKDTENRPKN
jgi:hypothetical protein